MVIDSLWEMERIKAELMFGADPESRNRLELEFFEQLRELSRTDIDPAPYAQWYARYEEIVTLPYRVKIAIGQAR
jgi:hypothetical protein